MRAFGWNSHYLGSCSYNKTKNLATSNALIVKGKVVMSQSIYFIFNVFAPQGRQEKKVIWDYILSFMSHNQGEYIIFGDFNVIQNLSERSGSFFANMKLITLTSLQQIWIFWICT